MLAPLSEPALARLLVGSLPRLRHLVAARRTLVDGGVALAAALARAPALEARNETRRRRTRV